MKNIIKYRLFLLLPLFLVLFVSNGNAQLRFDTKGTDFWITYIPNYHVNSNSFYDELSRGDSLFIFITADQLSSGKIDYMDRNGKLYTKNFIIVDVSKIFVFKVSWNDFELIGFNNSADLSSHNQSERIAPQYFHVTSDNEVTIYAHSQGVTTSDAFLVMPTDVLGNDYFIMSYESDGQFDGFSDISDQSTPSEFAILATEDNTKVTITPKEPTMYNGINPYPITLNKGQSYLVQALIDRNNLFTDLTGTKVQSDKPIAVFAGHQRSRLPHLTTAMGNSRDILIEQMPPTKTWGENAFLVPYAQPAGITRYGTDIFRILAAFDNTEIFINDVSVRVLKSGEFYENELTQPMKMTASNPVLVAQFKKTSQSGSGNAISDPFMMIIPPKEQYQDSYRIINVQTYQPEVNGYNSIPTGRYFKVYDTHYITVTVKNSSINSVLVDGVAIPQNTFTPIPTSNYSYANKEVTEGTHTVSANSDFGIFIYGYGIANSYGYIGGMSMKPLDLMPPQIVSLQSCFTVNGRAFDTTLSDSHIKALSVKDTQNVTVNLEQFNPYQDSVNFSAKLINQDYDGSATFVVQDSIGLISEKKYDIPGFTVSLKSKLNVMQTIDTTVGCRKLHCFDFTLENYGKFPQNIIRVSLANKKEFKLEYNLPAIIAPGGISSGRICVYSEVDTVLIDTLYIEGDCIGRQIIALRVKLEGDNNKPKLYKTSDTCNRSFNLIFTDSLSSDFGIEKTNIITKINCTIAQKRSSIMLAEFAIDVIDPYQDAFYEIETIDSAGFKTSISDTIQGFTLSFPGFAPDTPRQVNLGEKMIGEIGCDTLTIRNYGALPFIISDAYVLENLLFSVPQSQIPMTILSGENKELYVCYRPYRYETKPNHDTIRFTHNCLWQDIALIGTAEIFKADGMTECGFPIRVISKKTGKQFSVAINPNPIQEEAKISLALPESGRTVIEFVDLQSGNVFSAIDAVIESGEYEINYSTQNLPSGMYACRVNSAGKIISCKLVIMH